MDNNQFEYTENTAPQIKETTPFEKKIRKMLSSNAFLTATIAQTVAASISVIIHSLDVFSILFTIGMWLIYVAAKKEAPIKGMRFVSGTLKAYYIVEIIGIVMLIIAGVSLLVVSPALFKMDDNYINDILREVLGELESTELFFYSPDTIMSAINNNMGISVPALIRIVIVALGIVFIIIAVCSIIVNELFVRRFNKQISSASDALAIGESTELKLSGIRGWLIFFGVMASISAVSGFFSFYSIFSVASSAASATSMFALSTALDDTKGDF